MNSETATTLIDIHNPAATRGRSFSPSFVSGLIGVIDAFILLATELSIYALYVGWGDGNPPFYFTTIAIHTTLTVTGFYLAGLYKFDAIKRPLQRWRAMFAVSAIVFLLLIALAFALKMSLDFSRVWVFSSWLIGILLVSAARFCTHYFIRSWAESGHFTRNIVVLGAGEQSRRLLAELKRTNEPWNSVIGVFDDRETRWHPALNECGVQGNFEDLLTCIRRDRVDDVILALPWSAEARLCEYFEKLREFPVQVRVAPDLVAFRFHDKKFGSIGSVTTLDVVPKPIAGWQYLLKVAEDRIFAALLLFFLAPLMLTIALLIKLDSRGPVLFRQKRYGFNNNVFPVFKFRTMYHQPSSEDGEVKQAQRNDPRVTRVGRWLRMTSLDELPQLLNVLDGSMSLVGPRPHAVPHHEEYVRIVSNYSARHRTKPGITGWAQVNGLRGETDTLDKMKARVEHDCYYIENWSLLFDIKILFKTIAVVASFKNAY